MLTLTCTQIQRVNRAQRAQIRITTLCCQSSDPPVITPSSYGLLIILLLGRVTACAMYIHTLTVQQLASVCRGLGGAGDLIVRTHTRTHTRATYRPLASLCFIKGKFICRNQCGTQPGRSKADFTPVEIRSQSAPWPISRGRQQLWPFLRRVRRQSYLWRLLVCAARPFHNHSLGSLLYSDNAVKSIRFVLKICCSKSIGLIWNLVYTIQSPLVSKVQK